MVAGINTVYVMTVDSAVADYIKLYQIDAHHCILT